MSDPFDIASLISQAQKPIQQSARRPTPSGIQENKLDQACRDFEALFLGYMMQEMRKTVPDDGLFSGGRAEQMYTSMLDNEVAKSITKHNGLGLASMLYRQLGANSEKNEK